MTNTSDESNIRIRAIEKAPTDLRLLAKALIALAMAQADTESKIEAIRKARSEAEQKGRP